MNENGTLLEYEDDLIAALHKAYIDKDGDYEAQDEPYTITTPEARDILQLSRRKTVALLDRLCEKRVLKRIMIGRVNRWGYITRRAGYKLIKDD